MSCRETLHKRRAEVLQLERETSDMVVNGREAAFIQRWRDTAAEHDAHIAVVAGYVDDAQLLKCEDAAMRRFGVEFLAMMGVAHASLVTGLLIIGRVDRMERTGEWGERQTPEEWRAERDGIVSRLYGLVAQCK